jgi:sigma-B regulation protein RsbU (phosphoserine phosphatase)
VLLDVMMPDMGGFDVCQALKADADTHDSAVIFLSALGDVEDKVSGLMLGAVDYITKPIQPEEVQARVSNHLMRLYLERELRRSRDQLDRELAKAARLQQQLLPRVLPSHPALTFGPFYRTSRHAGGDYYDVIDLGSDRFAVIVVDVSGHGAPAAIVMAMIRTVLHTPAGCSADPAEALGSINNHFRYLWEDRIFATAVYAVIDVSAGTLRVACAGHPPPLVVRAGKAVSRLPVDATIPLLLTDIGHIPTSAHDLEPGDRILFFTDGITDRENADGVPYEVERLAAALDITRGFTAPATIDGLVADIEAFTGGQEPDDDQTLLLVGFK